MANKPFLTDIKTLRERARQHMHDGAVTEGYSADRETVGEAFERRVGDGARLRLTLQAPLFHGLGYSRGRCGRRSFSNTPTTSRGHADQIAHRIVQLKGAPNFNPDGLLMRSHAEYVEGDSLTI
jgi:bacterioferritin